MSAGRDWVGEYAQAHQHPVNRLCHSLGIPMIAVAIALGIASLRWPMWWYALGLFVAGWILQFVGHAYEGKPPEFLRDPRFLFVGLRWWFAKIRGKA